MFKKLAAKLFITWYVIHLAQEMVLMNSLKIINSLKIVLQLCYTAYTKRINAFSEIQVLLFWIPQMIICSFLIKETMCFDWKWAEEKNGRIEAIHIWQTKRKAIHSTNQSIILFCNIFQGETASKSFWSIAIK